MKRIIHSLIIACSLLATSCSDYLDVVPKSDIETIESNFEQRNDAESWLKTCYQMYTDMATSFTYQPGFLGADEFIGGQYAREIKKYGGESLMAPIFIGDGLQMASNPYCNIWKKDEAYCAIRYCNIFLDNIYNCGNMEKEEKDLWAGEIMALKAAYYLELLKRYGPFILVPQNIDAASETVAMQQPRASIDDCVNAIVELCDKAIALLPSQKAKEQNRQAYFNKEAAATVKAYALLYAASPLFNGNNQLKDFVNKNNVRLFPDYDKEKWHKAAVAADEAIKYATEGGKKLYQAYTDKGTDILNTIFNIQKSVLDDSYSNQEILQEFECQNGMETSYWSPYVKSTVTSLYDYYSKGCLAPSMKMVEMFYTEHGLPIDEDKQWVSNKYELSKEIDNRYQNVVPLNTDILSLHRRREPRFYADIAADRTYWYRPLNSVYKATLMECYQGENFGTQSSTINSTIPQSLSGYWLKKFTDSTQPFRNYSYNNKDRFKQVLFRLPELYLMSAEAWNEYLDQPNEHVYDMLDVVRERAGIPKVRAAWETYARNPEKVKTQSGMRSIIHQEWNIEFAFEGRRFYNLRRWMEAPQELNQAQYGWNITATDSRRFYNNFEGPVVVWKKRKFTAPRDYFFPIRSEEVLISGCVQNPGWGSKK